ncbi:MAG: M48 family metallopeptidase, partial [Deltaproteobacteria bacterium]|nr:M48 family metallopeptidase [Deltaproteobacteria bacterium]
RGYSGKSCEVTPKWSELHIRETGTGESLFSVEYKNITLSFGGTDNMYLVFTCKNNDESVTLMTKEFEEASMLINKIAGAAFKESLDDLFKSRKKRSKVKWTVLATVLLIFLLLLMGLKMLVKPAASKVVDAIPVSVETEIGKNGGLQVLNNNMICSDAELVSAVSNIGSRLVGVMDTTPYKWQLKILDVDDINAFALPGGYVFVNRGLIEASDSPEEVAAVLAHEFTHVIKRHGLKNVVVNVGLKVLVHLIMGGGEYTEQLIADNISMFASMSFSREQETEADIGGVKLLEKANIDPVNLELFMKKLKAKESSASKMLTFISTHPASGDRMDEIDKLIKNTPKVKYEKFDLNWEDLKKRCSPEKVSTFD